MDNTVSDSYSFKTPPSSSNSEEAIKLIYSGNIGDTSISDFLYSYIAKKDPDVVLLGGNVAYDYGQPQCYFLWDFFLN